MMQERPVPPEAALYILRDMSHARPHLHCGQSPLGCPGLPSLPLEAKTLGWSRSALFRVTSVGEVIKKKCPANGLQPEPLDLGTLTQQTDARGAGPAGRKGRGDCVGLCRLSPSLHTRPGLLGAGGLLGQGSCWGQGAMADFLHPRASLEVRATPSQPSRSQQQTGDAQVRTACEV